MMTDLVRTQPRDSRPEVAQDGRTGVAHLALHAQLRAHVYLADPRSKRRDKNGGDDGDGDDEHDSADTSDEEDRALEHRVQ